MHESHMYTQKSSCSCEKFHVTPESSPVSETGLEIFDSVPKIWADLSQMGISHNQVQ